MNDYKQWSGTTRSKRFREYKRAVATGQLKEPGPCEMCGQSEGIIHAHAEEYGPTAEDHYASLHSLCGRCHAMLHIRFRFPGHWAAYKQLVRCTGPQTPVKSLNQIYYGIRTDVPLVEYPSGETWWENLTTKRYEGPVY